MKKFLILPLLCLSMTVMAACSNDDTPAPETEQPTNPIGSGETRTLVAYFSAQGHTQAVAERITELLGADIFRIEAADPYAENPYDDSDRIQDEAYNSLRPEVANLPDAETIAAYDTLFVGSPCWWHQPAMVVCTFLEAYDLSGKVVIPFFTYGATTYLNESMQTIYRATPDSEHLPATLPEDLDPDNIREPQSDDAGIDMPGNANGVEAWLRELGILQ
ncbi:MAG TPA: flavodoxin [Candidatus Bacteroides avicola]|uniref:Flavodoxin n=1 Tax=Candidatus Bacteroides avicola TaxID=2838468 RepID=A0A9D2KW10_9BACE|nr:flavodoxin [Candidatus Bacteroides avicola]